MTDLISVDEIAAMTGSKREYARDTIVKRPDFPRPSLALSQKMKRWNRAEVEQWLTAQMKRNNR